MSSNVIQEALFSVCRDFVRHQSGGEWTESIIDADAASLRDLMLAKAELIVMAKNGASRQVADIKPRAPYKDMTVVAVDIAFEPGMLSWKPGDPIHG